MSFCACANGYKAPPIESGPEGQGVNRWALKYEMLAARRTLSGYARRIPVFRRPSSRAWSTGVRGRGSTVAAGAAFRPNTLRPSLASPSLLHRHLPVPWTLLSRGYAGKPQLSMDTESTTAAPINYIQFNYLLCKTYTTSSHK